MRPQPQAAYGVLAHMHEELKLAPTADTFDLLLRGFLDVGDIAGAHDALLALRRANVRARLATVRAAAAAARQKGSREAA